MDGAGPSSSSGNTDATPTQKRVQPPRKRRGVNMGNEIDQTIIDAQTWRVEKPLLDPDHPFHLTTDSSYAETAIDLGRIVKSFKHEQYYTRPEVIELYRQQRNIATPEVVSLKDEPSLSRFRPREADKTIVSNAQSDEVYHKRHKALEAHERRTRFRELEMMKQEHRKLKERMGQLATMDYMAFFQLSADSFSPIHPPVDLSNTFSEEVRLEGERRREEMLEAARTLDERYQFLLREEPKPEKKTKAALRPPQAPAKPVSAPADEAMDVEVVEDVDRERDHQEEVVTARPPMSTPAPKPKNKGGRPRVVPQVNSVAPQGSNAVASSSGRKSSRASKAPPASSLGKRRAGSSVAIEPVVDRTPTPPPPSSTATGTREMSVDLSEMERVSMEVSDVRTPMPPTPAPPPVISLRHRVIAMTEPPLTASPPPPIEPEQLPVVQGADEDEIISRPSKKLRMSTGTSPPRQSSALPASPPRQSSALPASPPRHSSALPATPSRLSSPPPASPARVASRWKVPSPAPTGTSVPRSPSLPPIVSLSSAEFEAEHKPETARESSPVPALEAMLEPASETAPEREPSREPLPKFQSAPERLSEVPHEPAPEESPEALAEPLSELLPEMEPEALPEAPPELAPETLPEPMSEALPRAGSPAEPLAVPGPSSKRERPDDGDDVDVKAESSTVSDPSIRGPRAPRCLQCKQAKSRCEARTEKDTCKRCLEMRFDCAFPIRKGVPAPAPDNVAAHKPRVLSEGPAAAGPSPSVHIMTPASSIPDLSPSVKIRSPSPEVPVVTASRRGRRSHGGPRPSVPRARYGRPKEDPQIIQAAQRTIGFRRKPQRHTDAFGAKLPEILKSVDEYDYELPEDILKDVPRMSGLDPDGSSSEDKVSESEERLREIPDPRPLVMCLTHLSDISNLTTRSTTPAVRTVAPVSEDPESDDNL